jgi:hypothetical protein
VPDYSRLSYRPSADATFGYASPVGIARSATPEPYFNIELNRDPQGVDFDGLMRELPGGIWRSQLVTLCGSIGWSGGQRVRRGAGLASAVMRAEVSSPSLT